MYKKITFLANVDYANVLTEHSNIINKYSEKYRSKIICMRPHGLKYKLQHDYDLSKHKNKIEEIKKWVNESDHIIFSEEFGFGDYLTLKNFTKLLSINLNNKKISVWHPGTNYRKSFKRFNNNSFNSRLYRKIYALDLYRLSNKEENDMVFLPFKSFNGDIDEYKNTIINKLNSEKIIITHYPSNPLRKGSDIINEVIGDIIKKDKKYIYDYDTKKPNEEIILKKNKSLFYIDQINDYESYGVAAIESMIEGNIVFCSIDKAKEGLLRVGVTEEEIPIINITKNKEKFNEIIVDYLLNHNYDINDLIEKNINYLVNYHYGPNIIKNIEEKILD
jgi:hypothetical protein